MALALVAHGLTRRFGERIAFEDLEFEVEEGEVFGFLGPNGAGKTTTVRTLGTLIRPTSGYASVAGLDLTPANAAEIRRRITIMTESPGLYTRLSVYENLEFYAGLYGIAAPAERIHSVLRAVNVENRAQDLAGTLSKGLRQRVAIARALLNEPRVMFLDEPTSGLDPVAARDVHELITELRRRDITIFLTTHRLDEAERLCDRVAILKTRLITLGRPDELRRGLFSASVEVRTARPLTEPGALFSAIAGVKEWRPGPAGEYLVSVTDAATVTPALARALVAAGADILSLGESRHSLEDVYLQLIGDDGEGDE